MQQSLSSSPRSGTAAGNDGRPESTPITPLTDRRGRRGSRAHGPGRLRVDVLPLESPQGVEFCSLRGRLYEQWWALWHRLPKEHRDPLTHPAWVASWAWTQGRGDGRDLRLFVLRSEDGEAGRGELVGVLILEVRRVAGGCVLVQETDSECGSLALAESAHEAALKALFSTHVPGAGRPRSLFLSRVDATNAMRSTSWPGFAVALDPRSVFDTRIGHDALMERFSGNFRSTLRRAHRRLARIGEVRHEIVTDPGQVEFALERFIAIDGRSWKHEDGATVQGDTAFGRMLARAIPAMSASGEAMVQLLSVGGIDVAGQISLQIGDELHVMKMSYDENYKEAAPGNVLFDLTLSEFGPERGISKVSLVVCLPWHARWRPWGLDTFGLWLFAPGVRGKWARFVDVPPIESVKHLAATLGIEDMARAGYRFITQRGR